MTATVFLDGISMWSPGAPGWDASRAALRGEAVLATDGAPARPAAALLGVNERRRAPDSVLVALQVASEAVAASGHDPATLASVFASAHADLAIVDALCSTLAADPLLLSPTRFHHSVHNAASGYWAIAHGCRAPSSAVAAYDRSFALGFVEAAALAIAEGRPALLAGFETEARGPLASVHTSRGLLGVALVLSPGRGPRSSWAIDVVHDPSARAAAPESVAGRSMAGNALADTIPLLEALATGRAANITLPPLRLQAMPL